MSAESDTPIETEDPFGYARVEYESFEDFATTHDVHQEFLPFQHRRLDPIATLTEIAAFLDERPPTAQRALLSGIEKTTPKARMAVTFRCLDAYMLVHGWWRGGETHSGPFYCNPDYCHSHGEGTITDPDARRDFLPMAAQYGIESTRLAPALGVEPAGTKRKTARRVSDYTQCLDSTYDELRTAGRVTMARTFRTLNAWGYSYSEIACAFGRPKSTVGMWIHRYASEFEPPADPTEGFTR